MSADIWQGKHEKRKDNARKAAIEKAPLSQFHVKVGLFLFGAILYAASLGHDYTQDDAIVIYENMYTTDGISGIPGLLSKDTFFGFFKVEGKSRLVQGGRYRPLTPVMFAVEWELVGDNPWLGHLINAFLYGLTGIIVFLVLQWIGRNSHLRKHALFFAIAGTVLYLVHPLHTEAVANIKGRDEMMSFLLSMSALWILLRSLPVVRPRNLLLSGVCLFLALLSKENAITFLLIIPLALVSFGKETWVRALRFTLPCLCAAVLFLALRGLVIGWSFGDTPMELMNNPFLKIEGNQYVPFTSGEKFATIVYTLGKYVQLLFFPHPLTHDYYPRHIGIMQIGDWQVILSLLTYVILIGLAIIGFMRQKVWGFGILFFLITLSIVSNIVFPIGTNMSERFMYMPSLGWSIVLASLLVLISRKSKKLGWVVLCLLAIPLIIKTEGRIPVWKDNYTLFTTDIETSANSAKLLVATGGEITTQLGTTPQTPERDAQLAQAIKYFDKAQSIHPNYKLSYLLEGNAQYYLKNWEKSVQAYHKVLSLDPNDTDANRNIAIAYRDGGRYYGEKEGDLRKAIDYLTEAYRYLPSDYETVHALGVSYGLMGDSQKALEYFKRGVELAPENGTAHFNLGLAYQRIGDVANAQKHHDRALELDPGILERRKAGRQ